jgi:hypothetical protein
MIWKIASLLGSVVVTVGVYLLAYRKIGKRPGQDPEFDKWMTFMSSTFKLMGVLGIIVIVCQVVVLFLG